VWMVEVLLKLGWCRECLVRNQGKNRATELVCQQKIKSTRAAVGVGWVQVETWAAGIQLGLTSKRASRGGVQLSSSV
jgi:hypothetical protein